MSAGGTADPQTLSSHCWILQAELRRAWLGHQAFEEALHFLLLLIQQACQQLQAALESHSPAARAAAAEDADHNPAACNEAQKPGVDKTVVDLIADSCEFLATHHCWYVMSVREGITRRNPISGASLCLSISISISTGSLVSQGI